MNEGIVNPEEIGKLEKTLRKVIVLGAVLPVLFMCIGVVLEPEYDSAKLLASLPQFPPYPFNFELFSDLELNIISIITLVILALHFISIPLLYFFLKISKQMWVYTLVIITVLWSLQSTPEIYYPWIDLPETVMAMADGIVFYLLYFTPLKEKFK